MSPPCSFQKEEVAPHGAQKLSGQGSERLGTEKHHAVGRLDKVQLFLFHPSVEHARSGSCKGRGGVDGEHHDLSSAFLTVQEDTLSV